MSDVNVTDVKGSENADLKTTIADAQAAAAPADETSPESLGVSKEQFDKYFKDGQYDWQSHAKEAEFKASQKGTQDPKADEPKAQDGPADDAAAKAVADAGLDWDALGSKVADKGDIDDSDREALEKIGVPKEIVDEYISNLTYKAEKHVEDVTAALGGEDGFKAISDFVNENYTETQIAELEKQLMDPAQYEMVADMLLAKAGRPPVEKGQIIAGPNAAAPGTTEAKPYGSEAEMIADQRDPRYKSDPAFRAQVYRRAGASDFNANPRAHTSGL